MPLPDTTWARGVPTLIQYMACGIPVIASPIGANLDVVPSHCGLLASSSQDWLSSLMYLYKHPESRQSFGANARSWVVKHYSLQRNLPYLVDVINNVHNNT